MRIVDQAPPTRYGAKRRHVKGPEPRPPAERFWAKVEKTPDPNGCWVWQGAMAQGGYGNFFVGPHRDSAHQLMTAHRFSWELANGSIPNGLWVLHICDNPPCVRPDHLFLGDALANMRDCIAKGRHISQTHPELMGRPGVKQRPETIRYGEAVPSAKLTTEKVRELRRRHAAGEGSYRELALEFGVTKRTVGDAIKGYTWSSREAAS